MCDKYEISSYKKLVDFVVEYGAEVLACRRMEELTQLMMQKARAKITPLAQVA